MLHCKEGQTYLRLIQLRISDLFKAILHASISLRRSPSGSSVHRWIKVVVLNSFSSKHWNGVIMLHLAHLIQFLQK